MKFAELDAVVLRRDMPEHGLRAGDLGAVVEVYGEDGIEVEFVEAYWSRSSGKDAEPLW